MTIKKIKDLDEFHAETKQGGNRLVLLYSAWCPFCVSFMPVFDEHAAAGNNTPVKVCTDDLPEIEDLFAVDVVPTVLFFKAGKLAARLDGQLGRGITGEGLKNFIEACGAPAGKSKN
jgi:thioredoxin-like negative regulator of GroEL